MDVRKFIIFTFAGAFLWSLVLTYAGYYLSSRWEEVSHFLRPFSFLVVAILLAVAGWYIWRHLKRRK